MSERTFWSEHPTLVKTGQTLGALGTGAVLLACGFVDNVRGTVSDTPPATPTSAAYTGFRLSPIAEAGKRSVDFRDNTCEFKDEETGFPYTQPVEDAMCNNKLKVESNGLVSTANFERSK